MKISKTSEICKFHILQNKIYIHISLLHISYVNSVTSKKNKFEDIKGVIRSRKFKEDRQHNG